MLGMYIIAGVFALIGFLVSSQLKSKFRQYQLIPVKGNLSGAEIAERMLKENDIHDVKVVSVEGRLTDHYNPTDKTVNLSADVYHGRNVAAAAVAAHECGHAVQHAHAYAWLTMRSQMVPVLSVTSRILPWVLIGGILMLNSFPQLLLIGIILFGATTLFSFVTLPVEFDASNRALVWLEKTGITPPEQHKLAKNALGWAASTYVVSALASLATLMYYVMIYMGRRN
jgi:Zn-dependent membrane protease YugP